MTQIQKRSTTLGVVLTIIVWILLVVCCFAIQVAPPHPDYKVIQINLVDAVKATPVVQPQPVQENQVPQPMQEEKVKSESVQKKSCISFPNAVSSLICEFT